MSGAIGQRLLFHKRESIPVRRPSYSFSYERGEGGSEVTVAPRADELPPWPIDLPLLRVNALLTVAARAQFHLQQFIGRDRVRGIEFLDVLRRLIGVDETARCLRKIGDLGTLDDKFHDQITNVEALSFYVYSTANGWHSYINSQLWSGNPNSDVAAFAQVLNSGLGRIVPISGKQGTVYRGYGTGDIDAFGAQYVQDEIVRFPAFTSASFSEAGAFGGNVLFIIRALSARAIWWLSPNFHEEEALLPTDCSFRVVDKEFQSVGGEHVKLVIVLQEIAKRP